MKTEPIGISPTNFSEINRDAFTLAVKSEVVQFVSAKPYLNVPDEEFNKLLWCMKGRKEVIVLCSHELKLKLAAIESEWTIPRISEFKEYLKAHGIPWTEDYKGTTTI